MSQFLTDDECRAAVEAMARCKNQREAAKELGIARSSLQRRLDAAERRFEKAPAPALDPIQFPEFPDDDAPIEDIIGLQVKRFQKRKASYAAHTWFPVKLRDSRPIGVLWFGDPHVDDNGCDWETLKRHCELCRTTPGLYGGNIGDTTNNWAGRLVQLYAKQDTSVKTARRMAEWFMLDSGVTWLVWLVGNHDSWQDGSDILARMGKKHGTKQITTHDWEARFSLSFPNGWQPHIYAAHDFPGHSQWNPLHGPMKAGAMGQEADLYVCGHKHNWAVFSYENPHRGSNQTFVRVRGFKFLDEYARRIGITEQQRGQSVMTVFDPSDRSIVAFDNPEKGAAFLTSLRNAR